MPSGDRQRTWFPEMVTYLRSHWNETLPVSKLVELRDHLDAMLHSIRSERRILPAVIRCSRCGSTAYGVQRVSVRAMILSLARFGIASADGVRALEKRWNQYRRSEKLDLYGKKADA